MFCVQMIGEEPGDLSMSMMIKLLTLQEFERIGNDNTIAAIWWDYLLTEIDWRAEHADDLDHIREQNMLDLTRLISEMELGINIQLQFRAPDCETLENELITISGAHMGLVIELSQAVRILQEDDYELRSCLNQHNQNNNPNFGAFQIVRTKKRERIAKKLGV